MRLEIKPDVVGWTLPVTGDVEIAVAGLLSAKLNYLVNVPGALGYLSRNMVSQSMTQYMDHLDVFTPASSDALWDMLNNIFDDINKKEAK